MLQNYALFLHFIFRSAQSNAAPLASTFDGRSAAERFRIRTRWTRLPSGKIRLSSALLSFENGADSCTYHCSFRCTERLRRQICSRRTTIQVWSKFCRAASACISSCLRRPACGWRSSPCPLRRISFPGHHFFSTMMIYVRCLDCRYCTCPHFVLSWCSWPLPIFSS